MMIMVVKMKNTMIGGLFILILFTLVMVPVVSGLTISPDGDLSDWGLNALSAGDWSQESTWIPSPGVYFVTEDNNNPLQVGKPGYYAPGVHIKGTSVNHPFYDEPLLQLKSNGKLVTAPYSGEKYDVEALYLTTDPTNIYVAVILSMPQEGYGKDGLGNPAYAHDETPGDLALHFTEVPAAKLGFEYGVKVNPWKKVGNYNPGDIVYLPNWSTKGYTYNQPPIPKELPDEMQSAIPLPGTQVVGKAALNYVLLPKQDNGASNWAMEVAIPRSAVNYYGNVGLSNVLMTQNCGNDNIYIPEFPTIAFSLAIIVGLVFVVVTKQQQKS